MLTILLLAATLSEPSPPTFFAPNEELGAYMLEAAEKNPGLQAMYAAWQAELKSIPQATALDNPMLSYSQILRSQDTNAIIELEQTLPWFGVLRAKGEKAAAVADAALLRFYATRNELFASLKKAYFDYALLGESINLVEAQADILKYVEDIVRSRYSVGLTPEQELLQVQIEQTELQDRFDGLHQRRPAVAAQLNQLLARNSGFELPWPQDVPLPSAPPPAPVVIARIHVSNPNLGSMNYIVESQQTEVKLARKMGYPEITLGVGYTAMRNMAQNRRQQEFLSAIMAGRDFAMEPTRRTLVDGAIQALDDSIMRESESVEDEIMVSMRISLPIWRKKVNAGIDQAKLMERQAHLEREDAALALEAAAKKALFEIQDAMRRYEVLNESLLPKANQTYETIVSSYSTGAEANFLELLNSERMLLEFQLQLVEAKRDLQTTTAELEMLMGEPWSSTPNGVLKDAQRENLHEKETEAEAVTPAANK